MTSVAPERTQLIELGVTGLETSAGQVLEEKLRQLQGKQGLLLYSELRDNDPVVGASLTAMGNLVRGVTWDVERAGDDQEDQENADFLRSTMEDMSHSWTEFISEVLTYWVFGWQWTEVVYKMRNGQDRKPSLNSRFNDGMIGVRKFAPRAQESFDRWVFNEQDNSVEAMVQRAVPRMDLITIPIQKSLLFTTVSRKRNPQGVSALRNAVRAYLIKKRLEEMEAIGIERDLTGLPVISAPAEWFHASAHANQKALLVQLQRIGRNVRMDEQGCVLLPMAYDPKTGEPTVKFELASTTGKRSHDTSKVIERWNRLIAMTLLTDVVLMGHEQVGSFALASSKTNILSASLGSYMDGIADILNRHHVPRLFALNGISAEKLPKFIHGDIETMPLKELGEYIGTISGAGADLFPDIDLENHLRNQAGLPNRVEEEE